MPTPLQTMPASVYFPISLYCCFFIFFFQFIFALYGRIRFNSLLSTIRNRRNYPVHFWFQSHQFVFNVGFCPRGKTWQVSFASSLGLDVSSLFSPSCHRPLALTWYYRVCQFKLLFSTAPPCFQVTTPCEFLFHQSYWLSWIAIYNYGQKLNLKSLLVRPSEFDRGRYASGEKTSNVLNGNSVLALLSFKRSFSQL